MNTLRVSSLLSLILGAGCGAATPRHELQKQTDLYRRGLTQLERIDGRAGQQVVARLRKTHPQLATYIVEFPFGAIYESIRFDAVTAELCVVSMLAAMGNAQPQLEVHIAAALHVGASAQEIQQAIYQSAVYAGFPAAINATKAASAVFEREGVDYDESPIDNESPQTWKQRGAAHLDSLRPGQRQAMEAAFEAVGAQIPAWVEGYAYGRILSRSGLDRTRRQLCTVAMLAALGLTEQLEFHVGAARQIGISAAHLEDVMYLLIPYAGFPRSINSLSVLRRVEATKVEDAAL